MVTKILFISPVRWMHSFLIAASTIIHIHYNGNIVCIHRCEILYINAHTQTNIRACMRTHARTHTHACTHTITGFGKIDLIGTLKNLNFKYNSHQNSLALSDSKLKCSNFYFALYYSTINDFNRLFSGNLYFRCFLRCKEFGCKSRPDHLQLPCEKEDQECSCNIHQQNRFLFQCRKDQFSQVVTYMYTHNRNLCHHRESMSTVNTITVHKKTNKL